MSNTMAFDLKANFTMRNPAEPNRTKLKRYKTIKNKNMPEKNETWTVYTLHSA